MPDDQGYHGAESASDDRIFKPKSHYASSDDDEEEGVQILAKISLAALE